MSKYRCSQCGQTYSHREYMDLEMVSRVTDDPNDKYGKETVCECGARFHSDKWHLLDEVEVADTEFKISTVDLTIPHGMYDNQWYETCVFYDGGSRVMERYETETEAEIGHEAFINALQNGEFDFEIESRRLVIDYE